MSGGARVLPPPPQALTLPPDPVTATNDAIQTEAQKAADEARKKAQAAGGRQSTILTNPLGSSASIPGSVQVKTLLGQ